MSSFPSLNNKVALVTGGASGIGEAACRALAKAGAHIIVCDADVPRAKSLAAELRNMHNRSSVGCDVTGAKEVREVLQSLDRIDFLVRIIRAEAGEPSAHSVIGVLDSSGSTAAHDGPAVSLAIPLLKKANGRIVTVVTASGDQGVEVQMDLPVQDIGASPTDERSVSTCGLRSSEHNRDKCSRATEREGNQLPGRHAKPNRDFSTALLEICAGPPPEARVRQRADSSRLRHRASHVPGQRFFEVLERVLRDVNTPGGRTILAFFLVLITFFAPGAEQARPASILVLSVLLIKDSRSRGLVSTVLEVLKPNQTRSSPVEGSRT